MVEMDTQNLTGDGIKEPGDKGNLNLWQKISGVLWGGPRETFEDIAARPGVAAIVILLTSVIFIFALPLMFKMKEFTIWSIQNNPAAASTPAHTVSMAATVAMVGTLVGAVLGPLIIWLIMAGLLKLFNAFTGENAPFKTLFAVTVYAYLPVMLASVIRAMLIMISPIQNIPKISTGLSMLLPGDHTGRLYVLLSQIDPFTIWGLVLLAVGSSVAMKVPAVKTGIYVGVLWVIFVLIAALITPSPAVGM